MNKYLLMLRGGEFQNYTQAEMANILKRYIDWGNELRERGIYVAGEELKESGRVLSGRDGQVVDGPFAETKEAVGGFYLFEAANYDEAVEIARGCPHLTFSGDVEIREINAHADDHE